MGLNCLICFLSDLRFKKCWYSHTFPTLHGFIFTGMMVPSLTSAVYFFVFLGLCTWWSCCQAFDPLIFSCLCVLMAIFSAGHLIGLYLYQLQFFQEVVPPKDFYARWEKFLSCLIVGIGCNDLLSHVDENGLPHNALTNFMCSFMFSLGRVNGFGLMKSCLGNCVQRARAGEGGKAIFVLFRVILRCEWEWFGWDRR